MRSRSPSADVTPEVPWWRELTTYHWFVFVVAALGWLFDTMDQQLFNLARKPAIIALLHTTSSDPRVDEYGPYTTSIFIMGWAVGGLVFGILGDRIGRVRTMLLTILAYSLFTGLSALSTGIWTFSLYRFLTGLGVGGEFAVGVALVAEVMPDRARPMALGWLQALSAVGNMTAALLSIMLGEAEKSGVIGSAWRAMFVIGVLPALLSLFIFKRLKEPEKWKAANAKRLADREAGLAGDEHKLGSIGELFSDPRWRKNTIVGMLLAFSGVVGLWGIAFTFWFLKSFYDIFWMIPIMGFCQLSLFGGYAIYFPELFPTRLRSTGTSFCYNVGRLIAAAGPLTLGLLTSKVFAGYEKIE